MTEREIATLARDRAVVRAAGARTAADECAGEVREAFAGVAVALDRLAAALPSLRAEESKS